MASIIVSIKDRQIQTFRVTQNVTHIGRDSTCELHIDNPSISRSHARIEYTDKGFIIIDENSANGVLIDGQRVDWAPLQHGSKTQLGKFVLTFSEHGGVDPQNFSNHSDGRRKPQSMGREGSETTHLSAEDMSKMRAALMEREAAEHEAQDLKSKNDRMKSMLMLISAAAIALGLAVVYLLVKS